MTATSVMSLSVFLSRSRSGMIGLAVGLAVLAVLGRERLRRGTALRLGAALGFLALVIALWANPAEVMSRLDETIAGTPDAADRWTIWRDTLPVVRDFWMAGTGSATYETAMLLYQRSYRSIVYFNQAHNQYLQVAAEGGLLLLLPLLVAAIAFIRTAGRLLREDGSGIFWVRAGALAGLAAVSVQNIWETGLRMPANALLFVALLAIAIHEDQLATAPPLDTPPPLRRV
jgi:O-antigen ligase